jgi:hypothetical protein
MIHLYRLIKELRYLIEKKQALPLIAAKDEEIMQGCQRLIEEHGEKSDVGRALVWIFAAANRMNRATRGQMALGNSGAFNFKLGMDDVETMEEGIKQIGKILAIEYEETQP